MTEAQIWVVLGVFATITAAFFVLAVIDCISVMRESLRADRDTRRAPSSD